MSSDEDRAFGAAIRVRRDQLGLSQRDLADLATMSAHTVCDVETGRISPQMFTARRIANALRRPLPFLLIDAEAALRDQEAAREGAA